MSVLKPAHKNRGKLLLPGRVFLRKIGLVVRLDNLRSRRVRIGINDLYSTSAIQRVEIGSVPVLIILLQSEDRIEDCPLLLTDGGTSDGVRVYLQMLDNINIGTVSKVKVLDTETREGIWDTPVANAGFQNLFRLRGMIWCWSMAHASPPLTRSRARFDGRLPVRTRRI